MIISQPKFIKIIFHYLDFRKKIKIRRHAISSFVVYCDIPANSVHHKLLKYWFVIGTLSNVEKDVLRILEI